MSRNLDECLAQAVQALSGVAPSEWQKLSVREAAFVLKILPAVPQLSNLRRRLALRLQNQLSTRWIEQGRAQEVFAVLAALYQYDRTKVTGEHLATATHRLISAEVKPGGPYRFTPQIAAHVQIALFTQAAAKPLPAVEAFLAHAVAAGTNMMALHDLFLLAKCMPQLFTRQKLRALPHTPLGWATRVAAAKAGAQHLMLTQQAGGFWRNKTPTDQLVTTAVVVGALAGAQPQKQSAWLGHQQRIITAAKAIFGACHEPLRTSALDVLARVSKSDKNFEITLPSRLFASALNTPDPLTPAQHDRLGLASLYGWMAYTIYDEFLDATGQPAQLPVANFALRASLDCFRAAWPHPKFLQQVTDAFNTMDQANAWELRHCRFVVAGDTFTIGNLPQFRQGRLLAERSWAHSLAVAAVLESAHLQPPHAPSQTVFPAQNSAVTPRETLVCEEHEVAGDEPPARLHPILTNKQQRVIQTAFRHYLIARQLTDDLLDWPQDFQNGQASYVVTALLRSIHLQPGTHNLAKTLKAMRRAFRRHVLPKTGSAVLRHIALARTGFQNGQVTRQDSDFWQLLNRLQRIAEQSLDAHNKAIQFNKVIK